MNIKNMKRSCEIFERLYSNEYFGADHDLIYGPPYEPEKFSSDELQELDDLGWTPNDDEEYWECFA